MKRKAFNLSPKQQKDQKMTNTYKVKFNNELNK